MNTSSVYIHSVSALNSSGSSSALREGSSVSVRVISSQADGRYVVSFGGGRYSVSADNPLEIGSVFKASVLLKDGKVALVPQGLQQSQIPLLKSFTLKNALPFSPLEDPQLLSFFSSLGLASDSLTMHLFQMMQQLGVKIDAKRLLKAYKASERFKGKEFEAAEAALVLEEKGLESTDEAISELLFNGNSHEYNQESQKHKSDGKKKDADDADVIMPEPSILSPDSELYASDRKKGKLTLFNHMKNEGGCVHWIVLPFEMQIATIKGGSGIMRLCLDTNKKYLKKMIISANSCGQKYSFVLYFTQKKKFCEKVLFSIEPIPEIGISKLKVLLSSVLHLDDSMIEWIEGKYLTPFAMEPWTLSFVDGCI